MFWTQIIATWVLCSCMFGPLLTRLFFYGVRRDDQMLAEFYGTS